MNRCLLLIIIMLGLVSCHKKDNHYYRQHVKELQIQAAQCANSNNACESLKTLALHMNELGRELQSNPQAFGNKILALQQTMAKQSERSMEEPQRQLSDFLAVVKWLESPEG